MPLIEGFGDEVTHFLVVMLVVIIGIVAWRSTSISEQPLIRTVLILEPHNRHSSIGTVATAAVSVAGQDTGQSDSGTRTERDLDEPTSGTTNEAIPAAAESKTEPSTTAQTLSDPNSGSGSDDITPEGPSTSSLPLSSPTEEQTSANELIPSIMDDNSSVDQPSELRRRRLQFFAEQRDSQNAYSPPYAIVESARIISQSYTVGESEETISEVDAADSEISCSCPDANSSELSPTSPPLCTCSASGSPEETCSCMDGNTNLTHSDSKETISSPCVDVDDIRIRLKYLNDNQKLVQGKLQEPLGDFKRRHFGIELEGNKVVRLIFNGQVLHSDDRTLQNYGLFDNCVVHCLVHPRRSISPNTDTGSSNSQVGDDLPAGANAVVVREWDLSQVLYLGLGFLLFLAWYLRISFPQLFTATSTFALLGLSIIFMITVVGLYIPNSDGILT